MFTRHRHGPTDELDYPHDFGSNTFSPQWSKSFRHILLLPPPSFAYHGRKPTNLRVGLGARAAQFQASSLRVRDHAGACSPPAQRTTTGYVGRCAEIVEARSITAFDWRRRTFLAKEVLRFQHSRLPAVYRKAPLHSSQSGKGWVVRTSGGLGVEQFSPLRNWLRGANRDRVGMDGPRTRTSRGKTLSSSATAPLKPNPGLSGPPAAPTRPPDLPPYIAPTHAPNLAALSLTCTSASGKRVGTRVAHSKFRVLCEI